MSRFLNCILFIFVSILPLRSEISAEKSVVLRIKYLDYKINDSYSVNISIVNLEPTKSIDKTIESKLGIQCNLVESDKSKIIRMQTCYISESNFNKLMIYDFNGSLDVFNGLWKFSKEGDKWTIKCYDLFDNKKMLFSHFVSNEDFKIIIDSIKQSVVDRELINLAWEKLINHTFPDK